jgi:ribokinase
MSRCDVVVVGSANVDLVVRVARLPAPGETVTQGELVRAMGGKGANAAVAAARLGARAALVAAVGDDPDGRAVVEDLAAHGVATGHVVVRDAPTGLAAITVDAAGENTIAVASGANALLDAAAVEAGLGEHAAPGTVVVANLEIGDDAVAAAAAHCARHGLELILDPGPARALPDAVIAACTVLTPNRGELAGLGAGGADALLARGAGAVVLTLGADGAELHRPGEPVVRQRAFAVDAHDSVGAGDAFAAALAVAWRRERTAPDALRFAAACGALATRATGARAALPDLDEVTALLAGASDTDEEDPHGRHPAA